MTIHFHIEIRVWYSRIGNPVYTYSVYQNGECIEYSTEPQYGNGDMALNNVIKMLLNKLEIEHTENKWYGSRYLREILKSTYSVIEVGRKKDLF